VIGNIVEEGSYGFLLFAREETKGNDLAVIEDALLGLGPVGQGSVHGTLSSHQTRRSPWKRKKSFETVNMMYKNRTLP
jgi:hypothetical protein